MKQLREHIKKTISRLVEEKYPAPPEIIDALKMDLKLSPLIRYVNTLKAANTVPPSYEVRLLNGTSFMIYYEDFSLMVRVGNKNYYLGDFQEKNQAIDQINKLLTNPQMGGEKTGETGETGDAEPTDTPTDEPAEEPAEEEPEA
jgi:hypothetical protein|tara:strand:- start:587 stop:1018 length:432 start_codon:yes stop_codon:yes gene_type:complete